MRHLRLEPGVFSIVWKKIIFVFQTLEKNKKTAMLCFPIIGQQPQGGNQESQ